MTQVTREPNSIEYSDGFLMTQTVWVVIRRNPNRIKVFLDRVEAEAHEGELWHRSIYQAMDGSIRNWSNFVRANR